MKQLLVLFALCLTPLLRAQSSGLPAPSLAQAGSPCTIVGQVPTSVDAQGNAANCTAVSRFMENDLTFSATPSFSASSTLNYMPLTGNVTSSTMAAGTSGQYVSIVLCQDAVGLHTFAWPANMKGAPVLSSAANKCSATVFVYVSSVTLWIALSPGVIGL